MKGECQKKRIRILSKPCRLMPVRISKSAIQCPMFRHSSSHPYFCLMEFSPQTKNILGLRLPTDPRWINLAERSLQDILTDHAYCEQKAAASCISLIQRYSDKEKLVDELS